MKRTITVVATAAILLGGCASKGPSGLPTGELFRSLEDSRMKITYDPELHQEFTVGLWVHALPGAVLESVRLVHPSQGLIMLQPYAVYVSDKHAGIGLDKTYPPKPRPKLYPIAGFVMAQDSQILVGLRVDREGVYTAEAVTVRYTVGSKLFEAQYPMSIVVTGKGNVP